MQALLINKHMFFSFIISAITLSFSSLAFSYDPGLTYKPSRDDILTADIDESMQGCVYRESDAGTGDWTVDDCDYVGAHYACYNGAEWQVSQALGTTINPGEPRDGSSVFKIKSVDSWDPTNADVLCKAKFGPSYFFSVPVTAEENEALGRAISDMTAAKKRTWVYYYSDTENIPLSENYWLGNRTQYTNLLSDSSGNAGDRGVADCTLMNRDTGLWQDASCSETHSFACYDSGTWLITAEQDEWKAGFAICDENYGLQTLYAVPRDSVENSAIAAAVLPSGGTGVSADYNKVWLNRTDLAFEEFFISNQTRQAWWGEGQPSNRNNSDCALIDSAGNWIAESCNGYVAYHACYLGDSSTGVAQWQLTKDVPDLKMSEFALGFGYCKQLPDNPHAEYRPPNSAISNNALAALLSPGEYVWINYSDQVSEGFWKVSSQFEDFVSTGDVLDGDAEDCGYFSLNTDSKRNWLAGQCYAGGEPLTQGFACTNGYEWKVATTSLSDGSSLESDLWKDGFTACEAAFGKDYEFAAPYDADQNSRLSLALRLSGNTQAWMNLNDAESEGEWVSNGPVVNLSPVIVSLSSERIFPENTDIQLSVTAEDPESASNVGLIYSWSIVDQRMGIEGTGTDTITPLDQTDISYDPLATPNEVTLSKTKLQLLNDDYYIDLQLQITDADQQTPATTTKIITIKVKSPLRAAYDFNEYTNPNLDTSGNGHDLILDKSQVEIISYEGNSNNYFAKLDSADSFSIDGSSGGLQLDSVKDQYTLIYRFRLDALPVSAFAGFVQKGDPQVRQPAIFFDKNAQQIHFSNSTTNGFNQAQNSIESVRIGQWMTVAYVKNGPQVEFYIDKAELNLSSPDPAPLNDEIRDSVQSLVGASLGYDSGDWVFGAISDAGEGMTGGLDDIRIYDRALTAAELATIFPSQPRGVFEFTNEIAAGDENEINNSVNEVLVPVSRVEGDDGIVSVEYSLESGSAELDVDFRLKDDVGVGSERGKGVLTWLVHDAEDKNIIVELIGDDLREGTETFSIELAQLPTEPALGSDTKIDINITDKTPNPYGAIGFAPITATDNIAVQEGDSGLITVERVGTDLQGSFDVLYEIEALTAHSPDDFSIDTQAGYVSTGASGVNTIIGNGRLSFTEALGQIRQTQTISFTSVLEGIPTPEFDEYFSVKLLGVTDPGSSTLATPATSAILGTNKFYTQIIQDKTIGRISFESASYSANEINQGGQENVLLVKFQRLDGDDGDLCITLNQAGSATETVDYTVDYLNPSASGKSDIYWADKDAADKAIQVTIIDDGAYDPSEDITLSWVVENTCNGIATDVPDGSEASDVVETTISIADYTTPITVKFTETSYSVSETIATGKKEVTVLATQTDFLNPVNNNTFEVFLNRGTGSSAIEGQHYGDLSSLEKITFNAGETQKTIEIPILDNCDAAASLSLEMALVNNDVSLMNSLPASLIDVSSANSSLEILEGTIPVAVSAAVSTVGVTDAANLSGGNYIVTGNGTTSGGFSSKKLKLESTNTTGDGCALAYEWEYVDAAPSLPKAGVGNAGSSLPSNFSSFAHVAGNNVSTSSEVGEFTLPFIVEDTALNYVLKVKHPEQVQQTVNIAVPIAANWSRVKNDRGWCTNIDGTTIGTSSTCSASTLRNFIFNPATKQVIGQSLYGGDYGCWQAIDSNDGNVLYRACSGEARQVITFLGDDENDNMQSSDGRDLVDTNNLFLGERGLRSLSDGNSGGQSGARKHWFWVN